MQTAPLTPTSAELAVLDSVITSIARSRRLRREDADDFRQTVHLRLVERDGDIFRRFHGRSSLRTYLTVVVHRMLLDCQNQALGKWRPSATAKRLGPVAVSIDRLIHRDGLSISEAAEHLAAQSQLDPAELRRIAVQLPARRTRRAVLIEHLPPDRVQFGDPLEERYVTMQIDRQRAALGRALAHLGRGDRRLIWLRYRRRQTVQSLAATLRTDPKKLYRRFDRILLGLRRELLRQGISGPSPAGQR